MQNNAGGDGCTQLVIGFFGNPHRFYSRRHLTLLAVQPLRNRLGDSDEERRGKIRLVKVPNLVVSPPLPPPTHVCLRI